jgi:hypothetical protein
MEINFETVEQELGDTIKHYAMENARLKALVKKLQQENEEAGFQQSQNYTEEVNK